MANTNESQPADDQITQPSRSRWTRLVSNVKGKLQQRKAKKEHETPADRAARVTAAATLWMAVFTFVLAATSAGTVWILKNQLKEMHEGGIDTHALAKATEDASAAASNQADSAQQFSDTAEDINSQMSDAVNQLSAAAESAKSSIKATQAAMRLDQRAWISPDIISINREPIEFDKVTQTNAYTISIPLNNTGKTPALNVQTFFLTQITGSIPNQPNWRLAAQGNDCPTS